MTLKPLNHILIKIVILDLIFFIRLWTKLTVGMVDLDQQGEIKQVTLWTSWR